MTIPHVSLFPCFRGRLGMILNNCLVYKRDLQKVLNNCTVCTVKDMHQAYKQAMAAPTKAAGEEIMKINGLHTVEVCDLYHLLIGHVLMEQFFKECILVFGKL